MPYCDKRSAKASSPTTLASLKGKCADRAIAAMARALERGLKETDTHKLEIEEDLAAILDYPAFRALLEQIRRQRNRDQVRYPVR